MRDKKLEAKPMLGVAAGERGKECAIKIKGKVHAGAGAGGGGGGREGKASVTTACPNGRWGVKTYFTS